MGPATRHSPTSPHVSSSSVRTVLGLTSRREESGFRVTARQGESLASALRPTRAEALAAVLELLHPLDSGEFSDS